MLAVVCSKMNTLLKVVDYSTGHFGCHCSKLLTYCFFLILLLIVDGECTISISDYPIKNNRMDSNEMSVVASQCHYAKRSNDTETFHLKYLLIFKKYNWT